MSRASFKELDAVAAEIGKLMRAEVYIDPTPAGMRPPPNLRRRDNNEPLNPAGLSKSELLGWMNAFLAGLKARPTGPLVPTGGHEYDFPAGEESSVWISVAGASVMVRRVEDDGAKGVKVELYELDKEDEDQPADECQLLL